MTNYITNEKAGEIVSSSGISLTSGEPHKIKNCC